MEQFTVKNYVKSRAAFEFLELFLCKKIDPRANRPRVRCYLLNHLHVFSAHPAADVNVAVFVLAHKPLTAFRQRLAA